MIASFILYIIYGLLWGLTIPFRLVSDVSTVSGVGGAITTATQYLATWNNILPLSTVLTCVGFLFVIELGLAVYKIIMWVIRRIPTQS